MRRAARSTSRRGAFGACLGCLALIAICQASLAFIAAPAAARADEGAIISRRMFLGASASMAVAQTFAGPAFADAPEKLEVSGVNGPRGAQINGLWDVVPGKQINSRAVYKKSNQEIYLLINDCAQFQMSNKISGECNGFATEQKGKWTIDGESVTSIKIRPLSKKDLEKEPEQKPIVQLPKFGLSGKETDVELLDGGSSNGVNVGNYIKAKGGASFLENIMKLEPEEEEVADRLMSKLR